MSLTAAATAQIVETHQRAKNDTGSSEVQVALLTARIEYLTEHLKSHKHDFHTRYGLTNLVSQRRRLLGYVKRKSITQYRELIKKLDIRG
ncbi:MAG: rpsO [Gammaproteobacteria bacterium]|jgi:small subunit ribosomal protein S15|nr:rpsO [Gammaproteobacteria bacterium]